MIKKHNIDLIPVKEKYNLDVAMKKIKNDIDMAIVILFMGSVYCQIKIENNDPKLLVTQAWNIQWDLVLLSALFDNDIFCNIQSNKRYESIDDNDCFLNITNYHLKGLNKNIYNINESDAIWIEANIKNARKLMDNDRFRNAVHSLASFRWHPIKRAQMALIWAGIEGLFEVESEIAFKLSLNIANFLKMNKEEKKNIFLKIKKMYGFRSAAVHGNKIKNSDIDIVKESATLLKEIILKCIEENELPNKDKLIFN